MNNARDESINFLENDNEKKRNDFSFVQEIVLRSDFLRLQKQSSVLKKNDKIILGLFFLKWASWFPFLNKNYFGRETSHF